jgi:hypothetical protein
MHMQSMPRRCPSLASTPSQQHTISSGPSLLNPFCLPVCATPVLPASRLLPQTNTQLSSGRRKRAVPEGTATPEAIGAFTLKGSFPLHKTTQPGILALALHPTEVRGMRGAVTPLQYRGTGGGRGCCTPALWAACAAHSFVAGCTAGLWWHILAAHSVHVKRVLRVQCQEGPAGTIAVRAAGHTVSSCCVLSTLCTVGLLHCAQLCAWMHCGLVGVC